MWSAPQLLPVWQLPQSIAAEQPSLMRPQSLLTMQTFGVHAPPELHTLAMWLAPLPPPQVWPDGQLPPQVSAPPQPSGWVPQFLGPQLTDVGQPHRCGVPPPPQLVPVAQLSPQSMVPPQLSEMTPHACASQPVFVHSAKSTAAPPRSRPLE